MSADTSTYVLLERKLPQELIDHTLGFVSLLDDNRDALRNCALVHSSWLHPCYSHLFRHLRIRIGDTSWVQAHRGELDRRVCLTIEECIESLGQLRLVPRYVQALELIIPNSGPSIPGPSSNSVGFCPGQILEIVDSFPTLTSLTLSGPSQLLPTAAFRISPSSQKERNLERLTFSGTRARGEPMSLLVRQFRRIDTVSFITSGRFGNYQRPLGHSTSPGTSGYDLPQVQGVRTMRFIGYSNSTLVKQAIQDYDMRSLSVLDFDNPAEGRFVHNHTYRSGPLSPINLVRLAANLESITVTLEPCREPDLDIIPIYPCQKLRRLCISASIHEDDDMLTMMAPDISQFITSPLEEIVVAMVFWIRVEQEEVEKTMQMLDWTKFDATLDPFLKLRTLHFQVSLKVLSDATTYDLCRGVLDEAFRCASGISHRMRDVLKWDIRNGLQLS